MLCHVGDVLYAFRTAGASKNNPNLVNLVLLCVMEFEWDLIKNQRNIEKHGIDFVDAVCIFKRPTLEVVDNRRDYGEKRIAAMGVVEDVLLYVVYTTRAGIRRIISARRANRREREKYFEIFSE